MKALIIIDMQVDFSAQGSLPVPRMETIVPNINEIMAFFADNNDLVVVSKDWHPLNHCSFADNHLGKEPFEVINLPSGVKQTLWPRHCVMNTPGADFVPTLAQRFIHHIIYKGSNPSADSYSAFFDNNHEFATELDKFLQTNKISDITIAGVATDYCVNYTVLDALELGYNVTVMANLIKGITNDPDELNKIYKNWTSKQVVVVF